MAQPVVRIRSIMVNSSEMVDRDQFRTWDVTIIVELGSPDLTRSQSAKEKSFDAAVRKALAEMKTWASSVADSLDALRTSISGN